MGMLGVAPEDQSIETHMPAASKKKAGSNAADARGGSRGNSSPAYWLFKSEPDAFSWAMLVAKGNAGEPWEGVRNYTARNNMRLMKIGDLGFFYHSNEGKDVVGVCEVIATVHPDASDATGKWECVDVKAIAAMPRPVSLVEAKANPKLAEMALVRTSRLSVQPVTPQEWKEVCRMGGLKGKPK
jgi:predicted RNA-binding protein with PUA-like domain